MIPVKSVIKIKRKVLMHLAGTYGSTVRWFKFNDDGTISFGDNNFETEFIKWYIDKGGELQSEVKAQNIFYNNKDGKWII